MKQITFITVPELKDVTIVQSNTDEKILSQSILEFQELELEPLLGEKLYKRLSNTLVSGATISGFTYSADDAELLRYIKPYLAYGALLYSLAPLHFKVTNKGVQKLTDANSTTADKSDITALKNNYTAKVDAYKARLITYMETDDSDETQPDCDAASDTTFNITGIYINDNVFDWEEEYRQRAYKTGYFRRF